MNKKLIIIAMAIALPFTVSAFPGEGSGSDGRHAKRMENLTKKLNLTDEQKSKLEVIFKEQRAKHQALKEETRERMRKILTGEQMEKMQEMKKHRQEKRDNKKAQKRQNKVNE